MREAVIVSAARTPIGRAFRGAFNQTPGATMAGHVVKHAMERFEVVLVLENRFNGQQLPADELHFFLPRRSHGAANAGCD